MIDLLAAHADTKPCQSTWEHRDRKVTLALTHHKRVLLTATGGILRQGGCLRVQSMESRPLY